MEGCGWVGRQSLGQGSCITGFVLGRGWVEAAVDKGVTIGFSDV